MGKDAKVWETYVKETDRSDHELVEGWNKSLDVLLIFAALFSAISTAFVIVSSEGLQQDPADTSAQTLLTISQALVAISNGQPANVSVTNEQDPSTSFKPSHASVIVNTLWFFSLSLSVAVSLVAMLAKEWCYSFMANRTGQMYEQGRRRQERWDGILRWKMKDVIAFLPMVMHAALLLFALGLCVYLWSIHVPVALPVVVTTCFGVLIYISTTVLPLLFEYCPYTTTSSKLLQSYLVHGYGFATRYIRLLLNRMVNPPGRGCGYSTGRLGRWEKLQRRTLTITDNTLKYCANLLRPNNLKPSGQTILFADSKLIMASGRVPMDAVTSDMLSWLLANSKDARVTTITLQSLAGADLRLPRLPLLQNGVLRVLHQRLEECLELDVKQNTYRLRDLVPVDTASLYLRGLNYILSFHNSEGFYLEYPLLWEGYANHLKYFERAVAKCTWDLDDDPLDISDLLTAGTHGSKLQLSVDYTGQPDLIALTNLYSQAVIYDYVGLRSPYYVDRTVRQTETIATLQLFIDGGVALHPYTIRAIIERETELLSTRYGVWDDLSPADQLEFPMILARLSCLPSDRKNPEVLHTVAVALMVSALVLASGEYPARDQVAVPAAPEPPSRAPTVASYHCRPKLLVGQGKRYSSLGGSMHRETESLLTFGLLALLEYPDAHKLCDFETIAQAIEGIGHNKSPSAPITYAYIYTLSESFTYTNHNQRVVGQLSNMEQDSIHNQIAKLRCIRALHDTHCTSAECSHHVAYLRCWSHAKSPELRAIVLEMLGERPLPYTPLEGELYHLLSRSDVLAKLDSALLLSVDARDTLTLVAVLWALIERIYRNGKDFVCQALNSVILDYDSGIPDSIWSLGLVERWLPKLKSVCSTHPQLAIQSWAVRQILGSFESKWPQYGRLLGYGGLENPPKSVVERAAKRYQQLPHQCKETPSVDAIHKLALHCVSEYRKQNGSTPLHPPPDARIPSGLIPPDTAEDNAIVWEDDEDT